MSLLLCLVATYPTKLSETQEWKAFMSVLNSKPYWAAMAYNKQANGNHFLFGASKSGFRFGASSLIETRWDGKIGIEMDPKRKTWCKISTLDSVDRCFQGGKPFFLREFYGDLSRQTWSDTKGKIAKIGWNSRYVGRDDEWESTYWFDVKSHLMVEASFSGCGMVSLPGHEGMYNLWWTFGKSDQVQWDLKPPTGYKRVD